MNPIPLPRWARIVIALACVGIGIASSAVAGWLLVRGLELTEPDDKARLILTAAGVLMIMTELTAFFLTALLPTARMYQLRVMGVALLVFEITTIYGTRLVLSDSAESAAVAHATRIENLQLSIDNRKADADRVRAAGERQAASDHAWSRHLGTLAIQKADTMEREIEPLREQLADLQASRRPTLQHALGPQLAQAHSIAMPVLVSSTGLVLFGVAGLMLRRNRDEVQPAQPAAQDRPDPVQPDHPVQVAPVQSISPAQAAPEHRTAVPHGAVPAVPQVVSPLHHWRSITAAVPLAAMSAAPVAVAAPAAETTVEAPAESAPAPEIEQARPDQVQPAADAGAAVQQEVAPQPDPVQHAPVQQVQPEMEPVQAADDAGTVEPVVGTVGDDRYQRLRAAVLAGQVKPSVRSVRDAGYGGTDAVRRHLQQLASDGVIVKSGQGYALAPNRSGPAK